MEKTTKEMKLIPIDELIPYVNNARTHSPEQINKLRASLREFGFINPVIIDRDKNIIAGHGRVMAAREEGIREVPCVLVDYLTEPRRKPISWPTTGWPWMPVGTRKCCGWKSSPSRVPISISASQASAMTKLPYLR